jgi:hypothetical protein
VCKDDFISDIKLRLREQGAGESELQRLVFKGKGLLDKRTCEEAGIQEGVTIHLVKRASTTSVSAPATQTTVPAPPVVKFVAKPSFSAEGAQLVRTDAFWQDLQTWCETRMSPADAAHFVSKTRASIK